MSAKFNPIHHSSPLLRVGVLIPGGGSLDRSPAPGRLVLDISQDSDNNDEGDEPTTENARGDDGILFGGVGIFVDSGAYKGSRL